MIDDKQVFDTIISESTKTFDYTVLEFHEIVKHGHVFFQAVTDSITQKSSKSVVQVYVETDAWYFCWYLMVVVASYCFLHSTLTGNFSQVDRIWPIMPMWYIWHFLIHHYLKSGNVDVRLMSMTAIVSVWGLRLTYNFYRKGGLTKGHEDYRWPVLRTKMPPVVFVIFNIVFISAYQHTLLLLTAAPGYVAYQNTDKKMCHTHLDHIAIWAFLGFLALEVKADEEQWAYYERRTQHRNLGQRTRPSTQINSDESVGFNRSGLFKYSRHPNFFSEQMLWWCIYLFSISCTGKLFSWSIVGAFLLSMLFQGSTSFTEEISLSKYPEYADYQKVTSRLIPWFPSAPKDKKA